MNSAMYWVYVALLVIGALGSVAFPLMYTIRVPWWHEEVGVHLFAFSALFALLYSRSVVGLLTGTTNKLWDEADTGDKWFYLFIAIAGAFVVWQRFWIFIKSQRELRKEDSRASS